MNKFRVIFFFGLLGVVILIARHNSKPTSRAESPTFTPPRAAIVSETPMPAPTLAPVIATAQTPAPPPQPSATVSAEFQKIANRIAPGVVLISSFDQTGKLLRNGTGCFISHDGRFITTSTLTKDAANAVAKASDGRIVNVSGILANAPDLDIAVLKADTKKGVPFNALNEAAPAEVGTRVAVIGSPLTRKQPACLEMTISARRSDQSGDWLELSAPIPNDWTGAPVVNDKGEMIGVVTSQRGQGDGTNVVRVAAMVDSLVAKIDPHAPIGWLVAQNGEVPSPAEGPTKPPRFAKISVVQAEQQGYTKLVYSPKPAYPIAGRHSAVPPQGSGRYRVTFADNGQVKNVEIIESTRNPTLDGAATDALRRWKATPGHEWSATVPITFQP